MGIPHACQRNKKFAERYPFFVSFVFNNPSIQIAILSMMYDSQTMDEQEIGQTIYLNHKGLAKGKDAERYTEIYEKWRDNGRKYDNLSCKDMAKLRTIHRYYPQFRDRMAEQGRFDALANIDAFYNAYATKCKNLIYRINQYIAAHQDENIDITPFTAIKNKIEWGCYLSKLERDFEEAKRNKIVYVQGALF